MSKLLGRQRAAGLGKESVYGTAVAPTQWVPFQEFSINDRKAILTDNSGIGTRDDILNTDTDYLYSDGNINGVIYPESFGLIALAAFGSVSTASHSTATGVKVHTFGLTNTLPSITISSEDTNEEVQYAGALLNQLEIAASTGGYATFSSSWMGRASASGSVTPSFTQEKGFRAQDVKLYIADSVEDLDEATKFCLTDFTFTLNNNLETNACLGSADPDFDPTVRNLSLTFNKTHMNTDFKALVMGTAPKAFRIEMIRSDVTIGSASDPEDNTNPSLVIDFEPGLFTEWNREGGLDDLMTESITYQPIRSFTAGKTLTMKITNTETSY